MVFDHAGNIYVTDTDNKTRSRLLELSADGKVRNQWRQFTFSPGARNGPEGLAITAGQTLLVTDGGASRILKIDRTRGVVGTFGTGVRFEDLGHIAVDRNGNVYVAEAGPNLIYKFSSNGRLLSRWYRPKGSGRDQWGGPETIAVQPNGNVVVEDWKNRRIEIVSSSGRTIKIFGGEGRSLGRFLLTAGIRVDSVGNIYVTDMALHRLQKFDVHGRFVRVIANTPQRRIFTNGPTAVAVDDTGAIYTPDGLSLLKLSQSGTVLSRWR